MPRHGVHAQVSADCRPVARIPTAGPPAAACLGFSRPSAPLRPVQPPCNFRAGTCKISPRHLPTCTERRISPTAPLQRQDAANDLDTALQLVGNKNYHPAFAYLIAFERLCQRSGIGCTHCQSRTNQRSQQRPRPDPPSLLSRCVELADNPFKWCRTRREHWQQAEVSASHRNPPSRPVARRGREVTEGNDLARSPPEANTRSMSLTDASTIVASYRCLLLCEFRRRCTSQYAQNPQKGIFVTGPNHLDCSPRNQDRSSARRRAHTK